MDTYKIGKFIALNRKKLNMTQQDLANLLDVSHKTISRWETGRHMPDLSMLIPLSERLEVSVHELLLGEYIEERNLKMKTKESMEAVVTLSEKNTKKRSMFYLSAIAVLVCVIAIMFTIYPFSFKGNVSECERVIEKNTLYSEEEIEIAMDLASEHFENMMYNCTLNVLYYDEINNNELSEYWTNWNQEHNPDFTQVIIISSIFNVGKIGGPSNLEKGKTYLDYYYVVTFFENGDRTVLYFGNNDFTD